MKYLLYYNLDSKFVTDQTNAGGDGTNVVSVVDGVAWTKDQEKTYYRLSGKDQDITAYTVTVKYKYITFHNNTTEYIADDDTITVDGYKNKKTKVVVFPKAIDGYVCLEEAKTVYVDENGATVEFEYDKKGDKEIVAYYLTTEDNQTIDLFESAVTGQNAVRNNVIRHMVCVSFDDGTPDILPVDLTSSSHTFANAGTHIVKYKYDKTITRIYFTFYSVKALKKLILPEGLEYLPNSHGNWAEAFGAKSGIRECALPSTLKELIQSSNSAVAGLFYDAPYGDVIIPDTVGGNIPMYSFIGVNAGKIKIGDGILRIRTQAFDYCDYLEEVEFGKEVTSINGFRKLVDHKKITKITCHSTVPPTFETTSFYDKCGNNGTLYYPAGSDYSAWLDPETGFLGQKGWTGQEI